MSKRKADYDDSDEDAKPAKKAKASKKKPAKAASRCSCALACTFVIDIDSRSSDETLIELARNRKVSVRKFKVNNTKPLKLFTRVLVFLLGRANCW